MIRRRFRLLSGLYRSGIGVVLFGMLCNEADVIAVKISILSKVEIVLKPSEESFYRIPNDEHVFVQHLGLEKALEQRKDPIVTFAGSSDTPVDIGRMLRLVLRHDGLMSDGKRLSLLASIKPSFCHFQYQAEPLDNMADLS